MVCKPVFDRVVLPEGPPGTSNLQKDEKVKEILLKMDRGNKKFPPFAPPRLFCNPPVCLKA
jgi:hypothetical protein